MVGHEQRLDRAEDVAANLIARPDIQAVGDTLFSNTKSQGWEYLKPQKEENNHG